VRILALDLSLVRTGAAEAVADESIATYSIQTVLRGPERLVQIRDAVAHRALGIKPRADVIVLEDYAYSRANQAHAIGELGGVVRVALHEAQVPVALVSTGQLKQYATSSGAAHKDQVMAAAARRGDREFANDDESDAWWLAQMAIAHYCPEHPGYVVMPARNQEVLGRIDWPELAERVA
jgi:crossover junction endodeoxyribonuclease RuvC